MVISEFLKKSITKSARFKEAQEQMNIQNKLIERQKSSNERELDRFHEEEREKSIKKNLEEFRNIRQKESMKTTVLAGPNMFKGKGIIMSGKATMLQNNHKLLSLKEGTQQKGMFFK